MASFAKLASQIGKLSINSASSSSSILQRIPAAFSAGQVRWTARGTEQSRVHSQLSELAQEYSLKLISHINSRKMHLALFTYDEMLEDGVEPSPRLYTQLLSACSFQGRGADAMKYIRNMRKGPTKPQVMHYNMAILACARTMLLTEAEELFGRLLQDGLRPDERTFNNMLQVYSCYGNIEKAEILLAEMKSTGIPLNKVTYIHMIHCARRAKNIDRVRSLFEEFKELRLQPVAQQKPRPSVQQQSFAEEDPDDVLSSGDSSSSHDLDPDLLASSEDPSSLSHSPTPSPPSSSAPQALSKKQLDLCIDVYNTLLESVADLGTNMVEAETLLEEMKRNGPEPNAISYSVMTIQYFRRGENDKAWKTFHFIRNEMKTMPTQTAVNFALKTGAISQYYPLAKQTLSDCVNDFFRPHISSLNSILESALNRKARNPLWKKMRAEKLQALSAESSSSSSSSSVSSPSSEPSQVQEQAESIQPEAASSNDVEVAPVEGANLQQDEGSVAEGSKSTEKQSKKEKAPFIPQYITQPDMECIRAVWHLIAASGVLPERRVLESLKDAVKAAEDKEMLKSITTHETECLRKLGLRAFFKRRFMVTDRGEIVEAHLSEDKRFIFNEKGQMKQVV